jgi:hypothetical protein
VPEEASLEAEPPLSLAAASLPAEDVSLALVVFAVVVEVEVVCAAASALVLVGGVMSGVLLGTLSETVLLPHAPSASPQSSATHAASAARALTTGPCACRTSGSR